MFEMKRERTFLNILICENTQTTEIYRILFVFNISQHSNDYHKTIYGKIKKQNLKKTIFICTSLYLYHFKFLGLEVNNLCVTKPSPKLGPPHTFRIVCKIISLSRKIMINKKLSERAGCGHRQFP